MNHQQGWPGTKHPYYIIYISSSSRRAQFAVGILRESPIPQNKPALVSPPTSDPWKYFGGPRFWAQWNQGVWGWCAGYLQLPRLTQIPRSPSMDPKLITTHDTGEVGFLENIFIQITTRGGWVPRKHVHQDRDRITRTADQPTTQVANLIPSILRLMMCPRVPKVSKHS